MVDQDGGSAGRITDRVLVATHLFPTDPREVRGPWVAEQVDALHDLVDIDVLCCSETARDGSELRDSGVAVTYRSIRTPVGHNRAGLLASSIRYDRAMRRYLDAHPEIRLVHAHFGLPDAIVAHRHTARTHLPLVVTLHGDDALKVLPRRDPIGAALRRAVAGADSVICVSSAMAETVKRVTPSVDPIVIANGFDDRLFSLSDAPRDLGLLFVGTLVPVKNIDLLLRAYASVRDRLGLPLTLAGDGVLRPSLEALSAELRLGDAVTFTGARSREEVAGLMGRARALLLPSRSEGWPLVIAESLARGTPVVASRVGGIPEILGSEEEGGILVTPGDVRSLAAALVEVTERGWDPRRVAASSRARPWRVQAGRIAAVYRNVLAARRNG